MEREKEKKYAKYNVLGIMKNLFSCFLFERKNKIRDLYATHLCKCV